jgi:hypothetical protein
LTFTLLTFAGLAFALLTLLALLALGGLGGFAGLLLQVAGGLRDLVARGLLLAGQALQCLGRIAIALDLLLAGGQACGGAFQTALGALLRRGCRLVTARSGFARALGGGGLCLLECRSRAGIDVGRLTARFARGLCFTRKLLSGALTGFGHGAL